MKKQHWYCVILAGGGGSRLWPLSRKKNPKQFLPLFGKETLLQSTFERIKSLVPEHHVYVVTHKDYVKELHAELPSIPKENILAEPEAKSTAIAIGFATHVIARCDKDAVVASLASDHLILEPLKFRAVLSAAFETAKKWPSLLTIGITPTSPHTGYGYIHAAEKLETIDRHPVYRVEEFVEKPDVETAKNYLTSGKYFWNASYFIFSVRTMLDALKNHMPDLAKRLEKIDHNMMEIYAESSSDPIEYGIFEKAKNVLMIPGDFTWSDVGDWAVIDEHTPKNHGSNTVVPDSTLMLAEDAEDCYVRSAKKLVALVGVRNLAVIDTGDVLLVCKKEKAQSVKNIVEMLKNLKQGRRYL